MSKILKNLILQRGFEEWSGQSKYFDFFPLKWMFLSRFRAGQFQSRYLASYGLRKRSNSFKEGVQIR
jgi:hypothetical protein